MSNKKEKKRRELEREIQELQRKLQRLYAEEGVEEDEGVDFVRPLPPLPPTPPPRTGKRKTIYSTTLEEGEPSEKARKIEKERMRLQREKLREELNKLRQELNVREKEYQKRKQEFERLRREIREKERLVREKERELRKRSYGSYSFDMDLDEDIEGMTSELETRLGEYTRSILASVAESLKSSMGIVIGSTSEVGKGLKTVGNELDKIGKEISQKITKDLYGTVGPRIPADKLEEFYEIGASIVSAIGDPNRLRILKELEKGPMYQKELSEITNLRGGTFKHHMDKLLDEKVKFVTQEVVRGRYILTTRGREALKLAEIQYMRYLEEKEKTKRREKASASKDSDEEFDVKIQ